MNKSVKQVIIIRKDLKMRRGKEIAQGAHASMAFLSQLFLAGELNVSEPVKLWLDGSYRKVVCQIDSEEEIVSLHERAKAAGLLSHLITDSGFTEFGRVATITALAIGPDFDDKIDEITSNLKLY